MSTQPYEATHTVTNTAILHITIDGAMLEAELAVPKAARGLVIFALTSSDSSRHSPRNHYIAHRLQSHAMATLLTDLLTGDEDSDYRSHFDITLLASRLTAITRWAEHGAWTEDLPIGYFGASTGATAAMRAALNSETTVQAIVSREGRVDLVSDNIGALHVPTLLIVGKEDYYVREANEEIFLKLLCTKEIAVIPHATYLFEEPGALERVARLASLWFTEYLGDPGNDSR